MKRPLKELFFDYCENFNLSFDKSTVDGVDYIIMNGDTFIGVIIKDWNRSIGIDAVIQAERLMKNKRSITGMLLLTNAYSEPAISLSERTLVKVINREEFVTTSVGEIL